MHPPTPSLLSCSFSFFLALCTILCCSSLCLLDSWVMAVRVEDLGVHAYLLLPEASLCGKEASQMGPLVARA